MFMIQAAPSKLKVVKKKLAEQGVHVLETIMDDYVLTLRDPKQHLPAELMPSLIIKQSNDSYISILKDAGIIEQMLGDAPDQFTYGTPVKITAGEYVGLCGRVVQNDAKTCLVEVELWGKVIPATIKHTDLEVRETPFR
jgi:transcription antitermination factor NusG